MAAKVFVLRLFTACVTLLIGSTFVMLNGRPAGAPERAGTVGGENASRSSPPAMSGPLRDGSVSRPSPRHFPDVLDSEDTVAGRLEIVETDYLVWYVRLDGKQILVDSGELAPKIYRDLNKKVDPFDDVIILTEGGGTCCEVDRFWFIGLRSNGETFVSRPIAGGFAESPKIESGMDYVIAKIRRGPESHGWGYLPGGEWVLRGGAVRRVRLSQGSK